MTWIAMLARILILLVGHPKSKINLKRNNSYVHVDKIIIINKLLEKSFDVNKWNV